MKRNPNWPSMQYHMQRILGILFIVAGLACDELIVVEELVEHPVPRRRVWYVHPDSAIKTIQAGLDSCAAGDTVIVSPGIYHEHIVWPNVTDIYLRSETYPEHTIIDADSTDRVITIAHPVTATINSFTVRHGYAWEDGAGIYCDSACQVSFYWLNVDSNYAHLGGAIYGGKNTILNIEYSWIINNIGGGIFGEQADVFLYDCIINGNHDVVSRGSGGGIYCSEGYLSALNCNITDNWVGGMYMHYAAGIVCDNASALMVNNLISGNSNQTQFGRGGGVAVISWGTYSPAVVSLEGNRIIGNSAPYGAGIYCSDGHAVIVKSTTIDSNSSYLAGAGIYSDSADLVVIGSHIRNNDGDGVCIASDSATINNCDITGNSGYGVVNQDSVHIVDAENNWWGDASGPAGAGSGSGDSVSAYVDFDPWRIQP